MTDLPAPLVPADCDLRDYRWMPIDIVALLNSDFNVNPNDAAWRAGVTLWMKAWHQVPAGSLPSDDAYLCNLCGLGRDLRTWKKIRTIALHGFVLCSDGRLYHPFLCTKVAEAWAEKQSFNERRSRDRERKRQGSSGGTPQETIISSAGIPAEMEDRSSGIPAEQDGFSAGIPAENAIRARVRQDRKEKEDSPLCVPPFETEPTAPAAPSPDEQGTPHATARDNRTRGTRLPVDWWPDGDDCAFARDLGLNPATVADRYRDHWHSQPGSKGVKLDWSATWRNWCRSDHERQAGRSGPGSSGRHPGSLVTAVRELVAEARGG